MEGGVGRGRGVGNGVRHIARDPISGNGEGEGGTHKLVSQSGEGEGSQSVGDVNFTFCFTVGMATLTSAKQAGFTKSVHVKFDAR